MTLRSATPADAVPLATLARAAISAKFQHLYAPQDFAAFLAQSHSVEATAGELADPGMCVAVIEEGGGLVAFCKLRLASTLHADFSAARRPIELKQLYTDPTLLGRGLGARLMDWALDQARAAGSDEVQLTVFSGNPDAQRFYRRYGFTHVADTEFWVGNHCDHEFIFTCPIT